MNDSQDTETQPDAPRRRSALHERVVRFRSLRSAWGALSLSALAVEKREIAALGRALNDALKRLVRKRSSDVDAAALWQLDLRLDSFEREMRAIASSVPIAQLRSTLPAGVVRDRRGVLDLLDLMLGAELAELDGTTERIPWVDYLITLLCTSDPEKGDEYLHDPVTLTPLLHRLCQRADVDYDPRLPQIEAEFFSAADMYEADVRVDATMRSLARRKMELGTSYFTPGVLRAIVTYNAALSQRVDEAAWESRDWGSLGVDDEVSSGSVFEAPAIRELAAALRRRAAGGAPDSRPIDRIAWCLDLGYTDKVERAALLSESVGLPEDVTGTAILVGLMCRSSVVLDEEFPAIGISPQRLETEWVPELDDAIKGEVNRLLANDEYQKACSLSELKSKFLYVPMSQVHRENRGRAPAKPEADSDARVGREAREIAGEALEQHAARASSAGRSAWQSWPWARLARIAGATAIASLCVLSIARALLPGAGLDRYSRDELARISPYLSHGVRNGQGSGPAFIGTIHDHWSGLAASERMEAATELVAALRTHGVSQIMVYDDEEQLRIQALGAQPVSVLPRSTTRAAGDGGW